MERIRKSRVILAFNSQDYLATKTSSSAETLARSVHDVTNREDEPLIARDSVHRDLHEPSIEEIAEFYGFEMSDL